MTTDTKIRHISESEHFYHRDGTPCYTQTIKSGPNKGQERPTALADARKLDLVPSVTKVMQEAYKPGLELWKQEQVLLAALTLPMINGETEQEYINRIIADSKEQGKQAAERGKQIHSWVQYGFECEYSFKEGEAFEYYLAVANVIEEECGIYKWDSELPFATSRYGGKVDLSQPSAEYIFDIKTKDKPLTDDVCKIWDEHAMQLSAYREGLKLPNAKCGIVFVSTVDISARLVWIKEECLQKGKSMFEALLDYWYAKTGLGN